MITNKFLLENQLKLLSKSEKRNYLLNCIDKSNKLSHLLIEEEDTSLESYKDFQEICKICKKNDFIKNKFEETCNNCGYVRNYTEFKKQFEKIEDKLSLSSNLIKINIDGKTITRDLNKINLWIQDKDYLTNDTIKIIEIIDNIKSTKAIPINDNIQNQTLNLWYKLNYLSTDKQQGTKKKALMALCIYYGFLISKINISIIQLGKIFDIDINIILQQNETLKDIFKNSEYIKYFTLSTKSNICEIQLLPHTEQIFNLVLKHLEIKSDKITSSEKAGIIYFITNKLNLSIKYTLKDLEKKCNISTTTIRKFNIKVENFYNLKPNLFKELISLKSSLN